MSPQSTDRCATVTVQRVLLWLSGLGTLAWGAQAAMCPLWSVLWEQLLYPHQAMGHNWQPVPKAHVLRLWELVACPSSTGRRRVFTLCEACVPPSPPRRKKEIPVPTHSPKWSKWRKCKRLEGMRKIRGMGFLEGTETRKKAQGWGRTEHPGAQSPGHA